MRQLLDDLATAGVIAFSTADIVAKTGMSASAASHLLGRAQRRNEVMRLQRGLWLNAARPGVSLRLAVAALTAPAPAYISLWTTLSDAGVIDQVPQMLYAVTTARPRRITTPLGTISLHRLPPAMMFGCTWDAHGRVLNAEPEKALVDVLYLAQRKRAFASPPELDSASLDRKRLLAFARRIPARRMRCGVLARLETLGLLWQGRS